MNFTVYVVWSLEDADNVDIFLDEIAANALYNDYHEFGCWEEREFTLEVKIGERR